MSLACERMAQIAMLDSGDVLQVGIQAPAMLTRLPSMPVILCTSARTQSFQDSLQSSLSRYHGISDVPKPRGMGIDGSKGKCDILVLCNCR